MTKTKKPTPKSRLSLCTGRETPFGYAQGKLLISTKYIDLSNTKSFTIKRSFSEPALSGVKVYTRMLQRAQVFSDTLVGSDMDVIESILEKSNAFAASNESVLKIII